MNKQLLYKVLSVLMLASLVLSACGAPTYSEAEVQATVNANQLTAMSASTQAPAATEAPASGAGNVNGSDDQNPIPFAQANTCFSLEKGQTYQVPDGLTIAGDVASEVAAGVFKDFYQSDIGEYTLIINKSGGPINVQTPPGWGAGCLQSTDVKTLVNGEYYNPNHGDLVSVRVITYTSKFTYEELWYLKKDLPLK